MNKKSPTKPKKDNPAAPADHLTDLSEKKLGTRKVPREQRMVQILEVAGVIFSKRGFHSSSMEEIAEGAGVTKPLLYRYFGSKDALYLATITQVGEHLLEGLNLLMANPNPKERLTYIMLGFLTFVDRHREGWSVLYNEALTLGPVGEKVSSFRNAFIQACARTIDQLHSNDAKATPDRTTDLSNAQAHIMVGAVEAGARWWIQHPAIPIREMQTLIEKSLMPGLEVAR